MKVRKTVYLSVQEYSDGEVPGFLGGTEKFTCTTNFIRLAKWFNHNFPKFCEWNKVQLQEVLKFIFSISIFNVVFLRTYTYTHLFDK